MELSTNLEIGLYFSVKPTAQSETKLPTRRQLFFTPSACEAQTRIDIGEWR